MLGFTYYTPTKVVFGKGSVERVGELMKQFGGTRVLIHYGGQSAVRSGVLDLENWDGANLVLPRTVTTALLEAAAERVIWHSHQSRYQRDINRLKQSL